MPDMFEINRARAKVITSLAEYFSTVDETVSVWRKDGAERPRPWFRGQRDISWPLAPSAYRGTLSYALEHEQFVEFTRRARALVSREPSGTWEWLFVAQHYGVPTRLLDWTESALAGLFFAIEARHDKRLFDATDAGVWILDPCWLNALSPVENYQIVRVQGSSPSEYLKPYEHAAPCPETHDVPLALIPDLTSPRIAAQRGTFTVFGEDENVLERLAAEESPHPVNLSLVRIPADSIDRVRAELDIAGMTESVVYPDLAGLGAEIARRHVPSG